MQLPMADQRRAARRRSSPPVAPPRSRHRVPWPQQQSTQMGPTLSSYAACTAARRVPCLEAWPAAVLCVGQGPPQVPRRAERCTFDARTLVAAPEPLTMPLLTACVCHARARVRCRARRRCRRRCRPLRSFFAGTGAISGPRTRRSSAACMTAAAGCSQAPSTAAGRHCGARHRRDAALLPMPSLAPLPPPSATTGRLCRRRRPSRCCVDHALLRPEARWVRRAPQRWLSGSEAAARGGGRSVPW